MASREIPKTVATQIDKILAAYDDPQFKELLQNFAANVERPIRNSAQLLPVVHSVKARLKATDHLKDKLERRYRQLAAKKVAFDVTPTNLPTKINDLAGIRILHLHTRQFEAIDKELQSLLDEYNFKILEGPFARTWDDEYREYFQRVGIRIEPSPSMYTSVHYVISSGSRTTMTCEIQVRTLMEEVWGEVDHQINYPHPHGSHALREQLRTLARSTSASTRLVDCIFACRTELEGGPQTGSKERKSPASNRKSGRREAKRSGSRRISRRG